MKYRLLIIVLFFSTCVEAQKVWDKETYAAMCKKQLNEVLAHIYELVIDGKLTAYQNDSFATKISINECKKRFSIEYLETLNEYRIPNVFYALEDTTQILKVAINGFGLIQSYLSSNAEKATFNTLGISLLYSSNVGDLEYGIGSFVLCTIKWEELKIALTKEENEYLQAYIIMAKLFGNFDFVRYYSKPNFEYDENLNWRIANYQSPSVNEMRIEYVMQYSINLIWHNLYFDAAHLAYSAGKPFYKDPQLTTKFKDLEKEVATKKIFQISNSDDPFDLRDTTIQILFDGTIDRFMLLQGPKKTNIIGFMASNIWFYIKLEDLTPYFSDLAKPSLELLKKEI
jgi:hypothetical protein